MVTQEKVEAIAREDAAKKYRDLSIYDVAIKPIKEGWSVEFTLKDKHLDGGGPVYVIDPTGKIVSAKYYQ